MAEPVDVTRARNFALGQLRLLCERAPKSHSDWSYGRALDFKAAVTAGKKVLAKGDKAPVSVVNSAVALLESFQ